MSEVSTDYVLKRLRREAFNSSHFVWLLADLKFFETSGGWLFAYQPVGRVTLFALEPLGPKNESENPFAIAWQEVATHLNVRIASFVGIGVEFAKQLEAIGFGVCRVGREPWIDLKDFQPRGNDGRSVR